MEKYTQTDVLNAIAELKKATDFLKECCEEKAKTCKELADEKESLMQANTDLLATKAELINKCEKAKPIIEAASTKIAAVIETLQKEV